MERSGNELDREQQELLEFEERRRRRRERRRRQMILAAAATLLALVLFGLTAYFTYQRGMKNLGASRRWTAPAATTATTAGAGSPAPAEEAPGWVNVLVIGTDEDIDRVGRTDTIMLVSFEPRSGAAGVLSIPRDTRVEIPGRAGFHRINVANALGGPELLMETVEQLLGVPVHHYVVLNFAGFERFIDALGGIEVEIERPMRYDDYAQGLHIDLPAGRQVLNGRQALHYVRYRADGLGDVSLVDPARGVYDGRVRRQLHFAELVARKVLSVGSLPRLPQLVQELFGMVRTDISLDRALALAVSARNLEPDRIKTAVLPGVGDTIGGASYWVHDPGRTRIVVDRVIRGLDLPTVEVLNGSGQQGAATRAADWLRRHGWDVVRVANAPSGVPYERTQLIVHKDGFDVDGLAALVSGRVDGGRVLVQRVQPVQRDPAFVQAGAGAGTGATGGSGGAGVSGGPGGAGGTGGNGTAAASAAAGDGTGVAADSGIGGVAAAAGAADSGPHATIILGLDFQD